ncbi:hypothetical protein Harreka1_3 [Olleya phage Harreka_1]|uniref:Uncharacterized protein n=1 Tax=Olleya phage Harreka_1 TaxID=2745673 RepID=A0A8E4ZLP4_9CAUD|nr:hypothetical protein M1M26_gp03 [Olleya phage Harreka_1]QQV90410.1 hypothetical protein Harreka1_3 [Olleya phage Harreka_1]
MNSIKICGVSINKDSLPTREALTQSALKTKDYVYKRNALELINKEITKSGLYRSDKPKSKKPTKKSRNTDRGTDNNKQPESTIVS